MGWDYEWDEAKRRSNIAKHGFDFVEAPGLLESVHLLRRSEHVGEARFVAIGRIGSHCAVVIFTHREERIRIISVRRARDYERKSFEIFEGQSPSVADGLEEG